MNHDTNDQKIQMDVKQTASVNDARRKFNKAGVIAPVVMSLASKSVWSVTCGVSGTMSGNLSQGCTNPTNGFTPDQFKGAAAWPKYDKNSLFSAVFGKTPGTSSGGNLDLFGANATLLEVLNGAAIVLTMDQLKALLGCSSAIRSADLHGPIKAYARQSIASLLNKELFARYNYAGASSFYGPFIASSTSVKCSDKVSAIKNATTSLQKLTT